MGLLVGPDRGRAVKVIHRGPKERTSQRRHGAAAVEFAIILPFLLLLLLGIWEVGRIVQVKQIVSNAAREGARAASTGTKDFDQVKAIIETYLTNSGVDPTGITVELTNATSGSGPADDPTQADQLDLLQIFVSLPVDNVRWLALDQVSDMNTIEARAEWRSMKDIPIDTSQFGGDQIPQNPL